MPYLIFILFKTGLRVGEALALTWEDIDFKQNLIKTHKRIDSARHTDTGKPKTPYSVREIPVSRDVIDILKELLQQQRTIIYFNSHKISYSLIGGTVYQQIMVLTRH